MERRLQKPLLAGRPQLPRGEGGGGGGGAGEGGPVRGEDLVLVRFISRGGTSLNCFPGRPEYVNGGKHCVVMFCDRRLAGAPPPRSAAARHG